MAQRKKTYSPPDIREEKTPSSSALLTISDLCFRWSISPASVYRLMKSGDLHPVKIGAHLRFRLADIASMETPR